MEPYKADRLPFEYKIDKEMLRLVSEANVRYGEYKSTQIVFTKKEVQEASGVSVNAVSNIINQLVDLNILVTDSSIIKKGYRYQRIYEVFVGQKDMM